MGCVSLEYLTNEKCKKWKLLFFGIERNKDRERERRVNVKEEELYLFKYKLSSATCECSLLRIILITNLVFVNFGILKPFTCNLQLIVHYFF